MAAAVINDVFQWMYDHADPRTRDYHIFRNPALILLIEFVYLSFILKIGPAWMKNRKPFNLKTTINVYNAFMVLTNAFFAYKFLRLTYFGGGYNVFCQPMTYSTDENTMKLAWYGYWYLWVRILDLVDTVFFVLRKKFELITLQHVLHHSLVVLNGYLFLYIGFDGQPFFGLSMNCCIHVIMYIYYFLAMLGPEYKKYLWWKKYLTKAQIYQHVIIILHGLIPIFYDCGYPRKFIMIMMPQGFLGLALFINFYKFAYLRKSFNDSVNNNVCILKND